MLGCYMKFAVAVSYQIFSHGETEYACHTLSVMPQQSLLDKRISSTSNISHRQNCILASMNTETCYGHGMLAKLLKKLPCTPGTCVQPHKIFVIYSVLQHHVYKTAIERHHNGGKQLCRRWWGTSSLRNEECNVTIDSRQNLNVLTRKNSLALSFFMNS